ncbi:MAG: RNA polymerase sigma factor [Edaphobacter sp.]|uniref:RNA polymerase sigma factor n=1 Tax=Edaphobacter sp. TaxID=1934404 RepID=UPI0023997BE9|nr:RNA polymerase sigma factor [Edaphobacter sp.]MDE1176245.1 RNA polymerase sigma factor [Edaphobacter sp.]
MTQRQELTQLFLQEKRYFLRVADRIVHNLDDAEDAVQTAFCSAWNAVDSFRGDSALKTWFTRIVQNAALNIIRKGRGGRTVSFEEYPEHLEGFELRWSASVEDPERITARREESRILHEQLHALPEETRMVFKLHLSGDCSIDTIAKMRHKSRPSVVAHLQRGKAILRKQVLRSVRGRAVAQTAV